MVYFEHFIEIHHHCFGLLHLATGTQLGEAVLELRLEVADAPDSDRDVHSSVALEVAPAEAALDAEVTAGDIVVVG